MRIAVIDSGVAIPHPHIGAIAGGVNVSDEGEAADFRDRLGHGTAVMAAIMEKAPNAEYLAVRIFRTALRAKIDHVTRAIEWSIDQRADLINLSLGTQNPEHAQKFAPLIERAAQVGSLLISAATALPGNLPGVIGVDLDVDCPRDELRCAHANGRIEFRASPYARPIPGVPLERNLNGISFAVANACGIIARDYDRFAAEFGISSRSNPRS